MSHGMYYESSFILGAKGILVRSKYVTLSSCDFVRLPYYHAEVFNLLLSNLTNEIVEEQVYKCCFNQIRIQ